MSGFQLFSQKNRLEKWVLYPSTKASGKREKKLFLLENYLPCPVVLSPTGPVCPVCCPVGVCPWFRVHVNSASELPGWILVNCAHVFWSNVHVKYSTTCQQHIVHNTKPLLELGPKHKIRNWLPVYFIQTITGFIWF